MWNINFNTYTSLFFLSNIYYLLDSNDIIYLLSFITLFITSVLFHYTKLDYLGNIDKLASYNIILQGGLRLYQNYYKSYKYTLIIICYFFSVVYLYLYGYMCDKYSFDKEKGHLYHGLLHFLSSMGHLFIISLIKM